MLSQEHQYILTLPFEYKYYYLLRSTFELDTCGFCTIDRSINKVRFENDDWLIWENTFGGKRSCKTMLVIVARQHWRKLSDITPDGWTSFEEMIAWATDNYDLPGGILFLRFGDMSFNTGTMPHLHWNIWVPDKDMEGDARKVWIPIQKTDDEEAADSVRTDEYAVRYEAGEIPEDL
jgi:hypothetical protein